MAKSKGKKPPPQTYRHDSSLSPALDWDGQLLVVKPLP